MALTKFDLTRGDRLSYPMQLLDPDGAPVDITNFSITSGVSRGRTFLSPITVTITDGPNGRFELTVESVVTQTWPIRELIANIEFDRPVDGIISSNKFIINVEDDPSYAG